MRLREVKNSRRPALPRVLRALTGRGVFRYCRDKPTFTIGREDKCGSSTGFGPPA
jgi:hypothetical protein